MTSLSRVEIYAKLLNLPNGFEKTIECMHALNDIINILYIEDRHDCIMQAFIVITGKCNMIDTP